MINRLLKYPVDWDIFPVHRFFFPVRRFSGVVVGLGLWLSAQAASSFGNLARLQVAMVRVNRARTRSMPR